MCKIQNIKYLCLIALSLVVIVASSSLDNVNESSDKKALWQEYKTKFSKEYSGEEDERRYQIFAANVDKVVAHNKKYDAGEVSYSQGINQFTDLTPEEFSKNNLGLRIPTKE